MGAHAQYRLPRIAPLAYSVGKRRSADRAPTTSMRAEVLPAKLECQLLGKIPCEIELTVP